MLKRKINLEVENSLVYWGTERTSLAGAVLGHEFYEMRYKQWARVRLYGALWTMLRVGAMHSHEGFTEV